MAELSTLEILKIIRRSQREGAEQTIQGILEHMAKNRLVRESQFNIKLFVKIMQEMTEIKD